MGRKTGKAKKPRSKAPGGSQKSRQPPALRLWEMLTLSDQTDANGRLLLEDSAPPAAIARADQIGIPRQTVSCPYADTPSRLSGLMNESAYEALRRDTADILDGFAWLAGNYLELVDSQKSTVQTLTDVSHLGLSLPLVLMARAANPIPRRGRLPSPIANLFKASRGVYSAAVDMFNKKGPDAVVTAADITAFADAEGHLRRPQTDRVCAAPTKLIQRTLSVMLTGEGANAGNSGLADWVDFDGLWDFFSVESELSDTLSEYGYLLNKVMETAGPAGPEALFATIVPGGGRVQNFGELTEDVLRKVNAAQVRLNEVLGRSKHAPKIDFHDLVKLI